MDQARLNVRATPEDIRAAIRTEVVRLLYKGTFVSVAANTLTAGLLVAVLWPVTDHRVALLWIGILFLFVCLRTGLAISYARRSTALNRRQRWFIAFACGLGSIALMWALASLLLFPVKEPMHQLFFVLAIGFIASGSVAVLAPSPVLMVGFIGLVVLPLGLRFLLLGEPMQQLIGGFVLLYCVGIMGAAMNVAHAISDNIHARMAAIPRERRLIEQQALLEQTQHLAAIGGWEYSIDGKLLSWSDEISRILELPPDEQPDGQTALKYATPEAQDAIALAVHEAIHEGRPYDLELPFITAQDNKRWLRIIGKPEIAEGRSVRLYGVMQDVTRHHHVEQMKDEFIATISHELRTPLTALHGGLSLLSNAHGKQLDDAGRELIEMAIRNSARLTRLIDELLDMSKIVAGHLQVHMDPQPLMPLIEQSVADFQSRAEVLGVHLQLDRAQKSWWVRVDADRLHQVLGNMLTNALKYSSRGDEIRVTAAERRGGHVRVDICDQGPGVPKSFHDQIFTKFAQADSSNSRSQSGAGLGLAISRALIEMMGGEIGFEAVAAGGACFYFCLPVHRA